MNIISKLFCKMSPMMFCLTRKKLKLIFQWLHQCRMKRVSFLNKKFTTNLKKKTFALMNTKFLSIPINFSNYIRLPFTKTQMARKKEQGMKFLIFIFSENIHQVEICFTGVGMVFHYLKE